MQCLNPFRLILALCSYCVSAIWRVLSAVVQAAVGACTGECRREATNITSALHDWWSDWWPRLLKKTHETMLLLQTSSKRSSPVLGWLVVLFVESCVALYLGASHVVKTLRAAGGLAGRAQQPEDAALYYVHQLILPTLLVSAVWFFPGWCVLPLLAGACSFIGGATVWGRAHHADKHAHTAPGRCGICMHAAPDHVLDPCGHMLCGECWVKERTRQRGDVCTPAPRGGQLCPFCRAQVQKSIKIFHS